MPLARLAILTAVLTAGAGAHPPTEPPVDESKAERDALPTSKLLADLVPLRVKHPGKPAS